MTTICRRQPDSLSETLTTDIPSLIGMSCRVVGRLAVGCPVRKKKEQAGSADISRLILAVSAGQVSTVTRACPRCGEWRLIEQVDPERRFCNVCAYMWSSGSRAENSAGSVFMATGCAECPRCGEWRWTERQRWFCLVCAHLWSMGSEKNEGVKA